MDGFFGALGALLPLALLLLAIGVIVYVSRRRARLRAEGNPGAAEELKGVHGWLASFVFSIAVLAPCMLGTRTAMGLDQLERATPALLDLPNWGNYRTASYFAIVAYSAWCWFVAYRLCTWFHRSTVTQVRIFLVLGPVFLAGVDATSAYALFGVTSFADSVASIGPSVLPAIVWLLYFGLSRRVKNTYLDIPALSVALHPTPEFEPTDVVNLQTPADG